MSRLRRPLFIVVGVLVVLLIAIQLVPVNGRTNPPVTNPVAWDSPETEALVRTACYDCHSNETRWPWYGYVAPMSWLLADHVSEGRSALNFSTSSGELEAEDIIREVESGSMPRWDYLLLHPEARFTEEQKAQFIAGIEASLGGREGGRGGSD